MGGKEGETSVQIRQLLAHDQDTWSQLLSNLLAGDALVALAVKSWKHGGLLAAPALAPDSILTTRMLCSGRRYSLSTGSTLMGSAGLLAQEN
eukprot:364250-Chlamydomonas_euryale.AAC.10